MIKNKCGFLGIGAYGGNQCLPFYKAGYACLFINTALPDLNSLTEVDEKFKYHIQGGEGCNKDRKKSKEIFRKDMDNIVNEIKDKLAGIEFLFIVGSSGGGTASGILASMKRIAMNEMELKACVVVTVIPNTKTESVRAMMNCYETLAELEQLDGEPGATFILDNDKNSNKLRINEMFFCFLDALLTNDSSSILGNLDNAEVEELLSTNGVAIISKLGKDKSDTQQLINTLHNNIYAPLEEDGVIKYIGLINVGNGKNIRIEDLYAEIGTPFDTFVGFEADSTICIMAGCSLPYGKMQEIKEIIESNKDSVKKSLELKSKNRLTESFDFFAEKPKENKTKEKKKSNRDLLF